MKLEKIKLAGFKSFVDPTTIPITGNLTAIVGPNGCGKSNIIDAVRWVMGESSAKHLRGGSMADVIFNGSSGRKPVSTASVELVFNNTESKLGGEYAQYDTIAIKRQVSRDGQSLFMLNGSRCRRKDITDLFLGTGLGSRSYAIIEQGTISRMVEAKPEDLRIHIEEAAGISKYKERRQETETRMRHTRENLERLDDLREEVEKQLKHLKNQSEKAEKYTELKKQERQSKLELLAMRWRSYQQVAEQLEQRLHSTATEHNRLFVQVRELDSQIAEQRATYKNQQQQTNASQGDYYGLVADVSRLEQAIKHNQQSQEQTLQELQRTRSQAIELNDELAADMEILEDIRQQLHDNHSQQQLAEQQYQELQDRQQQSQQQQQDWQQQWDGYRTESARYKEQAEVQRVKSTQLENQNRQLQNRAEKLDNERGGLSDNDLPEQLAELQEAIQQLAEQREQLHTELDHQHQTIGEQRQQLKYCHEQLHSRRSELANVKGKIASLELLQQHALGKDNQTLTNWLSAASIEKQPRLAEFLDVTSGWETAVETVLGGYLEAICVEQFANLIGNLEQLADESLILLATSQVSANSAAPTKLPQLLDKLTAPWPLASLLSGIYCANNSHEAYQLSTQLQAHESVITPDGSWFGAGWLKISRSKDSKTGMLQREKDLRDLKQRQLALLDECEALEDQQEQVESQLKAAESSRENQQCQHNQLGTELSSLNAKLSAQSARHEQQNRRLSQLDRELEEIHQELAENTETIAEYWLLQDDAEQRLAAQERQRQQLENLSEQVQREYQEMNAAVNNARQQLYQLKAKQDSLRSTEQATGKQIERLHLHQQQAASRIAEFEIKQQQALLPLDDEQQQLTEKSAEKHLLEAQLKQQRQQQDATEAAINQLAEQQLRAQRDLEKQKESLDQLRFELQESQVRQQTVTEQLKEQEADAKHILQNLSAQAEEQAWKRKVDDLVREIERLGTINLSAIEEYQSQAERMKFLNAQHADLTEALNTLDHAINKIDHESRLRFKETFDKINSGLQEKFPKLFGGGQAYLELTDQDLLESGVNIIARPPGKRNSSIHLLSGGEKALTAVALVFSIFELNPAPFCLLDEVDAPLDDANVGRFSKMVEEMAASVQFLYISHNKVTMEIAQQLAGVTMKEPGVSRMVSVDIEEAVNLAEN